MLTDSESNTSQDTVSSKDEVDHPIIRRAITALGGRKMVYVYAGVWLPCFLLAYTGRLEDAAFSNITITVIVALVGGNVGSKFANALNPFEMGGGRARRSTPMPIHVKPPKEVKVEEDPQVAEEF